MPAAQTLDKVKNPAMRYLFTKNKTASTLKSEHFLLFIDNLPIND